MRATLIIVFTNFIDPSEQALPYPPQPLMTGFPTPHSLPKSDNPGGYAQQGFQPNATGYFIPPPQPQMVYPSPQSSNQTFNSDHDGNVSASECIVEDPNWKGFSDKAIRNAFIRKVILFF